jgi:prepilin-type N-terminal cleavage/methylation domain-containing protein
MKRGFTLIELLVYMAIMGFIIVVAGRVFSDSTVMRVRSQNMIKTAEEVGKIANLISEDISQMGVKAWGKDEPNGDYKIYNTENAGANLKLVYMTPEGANNDSSSFKLERDATASSTSDRQFDRLIFRKAEFDEDKGEFLGVREITWDVNDRNQLRRKCQTIGGDEDAKVCPKEDPEPVIVADNIKKFSFFLSRPGNPSDLNTAKDTVFPLPLSEPDRKAFKLIPNDAGNNMRPIHPEYTNNSTVATIRKFFGNSADPSERIFYENYLALPGETQISNCLKVPIEKGETYVVEFNTPFPKGNESSVDDNPESSGQFLPGKDHFAVGLRLNNGKEVTNISSDVLLYASQSYEADNRPRYAEFTANEEFALEDNEKVCVALIFSFYSHLANNGELKFSDFKVFKKPTGAYHFVKKSDVYKDEDEAKYATEKDDDNVKVSRKRNVKALELLLEIERNGEVAGTVSKDSKGMVIPVPNNGVTSL